MKTMADCTALQYYLNSEIEVLEELMNGRLKILYELGITHVITEIANWNLASLQIAYSHGFVKIGELFIEIDRSSPRNKKIVRF
jgi:hypothetical protein